MPSKQRKNMTLAHEWRERIRTGVIIDRLQKHALGEVEMTASQVRAAELLLKRTWPERQAVAMTVTTNPVAELIEEITQDQFTLPNRR